MLKILIPVDGSELSLDAVRHALLLTGWGLKARFVVANVQSPANLYELVVAHDPNVLQQVSEAAGRDLVRPAVQLLQAAGLQVPVLTLGLPDEFVEHGDPARLLALVGLDAAGIEQSVRKRFSGHLSLRARSVAGCATESDTPATAKQISSLRARWSKQRVRISCITSSTSTMQRLPKPCEDCSLTLSRCSGHRSSGPRCSGWAAAGC